MNEWNMSLGLRRRHGVCLSNDVVKLSQKVEIFPPLFFLELIVF